MCRAQRGFTLAELLLVLVVVGLLASLGLPMFLSAWRTSEARAGAEELATALSGARQLALNRNETVCVTLASATLPSGAVQWTVQYRPATCAATPVTEVRLANNVTVTAPNPDVSFTYLGAATPPANYTYTVTRQDGGSLNVNVSASGRVRVQ